MSMASTHLFIQIVLNQELNNEPKKAACRESCAEEAQAEPPPLREVYIDFRTHTFIHFIVYKTINKQAQRCNAKY